MMVILQDSEITELNYLDLDIFLEQYNELISIYKSRIEEMLR